MTATVTDTRITYGECQALIRYANGETIRQIAKETGASVKDVHDLITNVAENNRGRALKLVDEYEKTQAAPAAAEPEEPPAEKPVQVLNGPSDIVDLLDAAVATGDSELAGHVDRISSLVGDLRKMLHEHTMRAEARAALVDEEARLHARLAEIRAQLDALGGEKP